MLPKSVALLVISCGILVLAGEKTKVTKCTNGAQLPIEVNIPGCSTPPCAIKLGESISAYVNFTAPLHTYALKAKAIATTSIIPFPVDYPLPQPNACKALTNTHCPLEINEPAQYKLEMPISDKFPSLDFLLRIYLEANDEKDNIATCFEVLCKTVN
ncbi:NPC intracellular cholesterol transporter 2-like [Photinus pyralis]|uniref:NPC intracellular cholesterol transporter 2-like n=1 Tax=Photinus pyralis TaxID=7054 RepID=UPI001266F115|nr:NPC intracellular cholesterol transporter 2-like [Photinus pyralis]XP_031348635.1 NPC intracellular cholesterol transporter 2-like [Photinus pyralis]